MSSRGAFMLQTGKPETVQEVEQRSSCKKSKRWNKSQNSPRGGTRARTVQELKKPETVLACVNTRSSSKLDDFVELDDEANVVGTEEFADEGDESLQAYTPTKRTENP